LAYSALIKAPALLGYRKIEAHFITPPLAEVSCILLRNGEPESVSFHGVQASKRERALFSEPTP
jgi:hypothetical protein